VSHLSFLIHPLAAFSKPGDLSPTPKPEDPASKSLLAAAEDADLDLESLSEKTGVLRAILDAVAGELATKEAILTEWDQKVGDGDCGTAWRSGATALKAKASEEEAHFLLKVASAGVVDGDPTSWANPLFFLAVADALGDAMGGTSGAICQVFFRAFAAAISTMDAAEGDDKYKKSFAEASRKVSEYGGAKPGMRTLVDALAPAADVLASGGSIGAAAEACLAGAEQTKGMQASAGRSSYVPDEVLGEIPDPGAMAVAFCMQAISKAFGADA